MSRHHDLHGDGRFTPFDFFRERKAREAARAARAAKRRPSWHERLRSWVRWWLTSPDWAADGQPGPSFSSQPETESAFLRGCREGAAKVDRERSGRSEVEPAPESAFEAVAHARVVAHARGERELARVLHCVALMHAAGREGELVAFFEMVSAGNRAQLPEGRVH